MACVKDLGNLVYGLHHRCRCSTGNYWSGTGHNDFYRSVINASTAWLYGCCGVNTSLFGIGERTGNTPLEAMVMEYAQLRGTLDGMDTTVITELG